MSSSLFSTLSTLPSFYSSSRRQKVYIHCNRRGRDAHRLSSRIGLTLEEMAKLFGDEAGTHEVLDKKQSEKESSEDKHELEHV